MNHNWETIKHKWYRFRKSDKELDKFFEHHTPDFWRNLTLIDVIGIALKSERAAETAYDENYADFRAFCNYTWETKILDFRRFRNLQLEQFKLLQHTFEANTVIFTGNLPRNFLKNIFKGHNFIFYTSKKQYDGLPLLRPDYRSYKTVNLTINGTYNIKLTDPTNEILLTFQDIDKLVFNTTCFTIDKIGILHSNRFYKLYMDNCTIDGPYSKNLARCIVQRGIFLSEIAIRFNEKNSPMNYVIQYILEHIKEMDIKKLKITMRKTETSLKILENLKQSNTKSQLSLTIYINRSEPPPFEGEMSDREFLHRLKYLKLRKMKIQGYEVRTIDWENNEWYF